MLKLDFNDLLIVPKSTSNISSRSEVNPFTDAGFLPIMTAPMDTVVSEKNIKLFTDNKIGVCLPRGIDSLVGFKSYSISDIQTLLRGYQDFGLPIKIDSYLIDVANGHMEVILELTKALKEANPFITLMVGNVANPETYGLLSDAGADYVRVGIGNGGGCLTTQHTGIGYPMASLIKECYDVSVTLKDPAYIVADGGMQTYSDVIKALALGADWVMLGSVLNKSLESAGDNYLWKKVKINGFFANFLYNCGATVYKKFRGMSTKEVQRKNGAAIIKTSEGVVRYRKVEYNLYKWSENFESYLRSAMSYTGAHNLKEFIGQVDLVQISDNAYKRFNK
jgi:IMP dehydrogenase/GMP reductase